MTVREVELWGNFDSRELWLWVNCDCGGRVAVGDVWLQGKCDFKENVIAGGHLQSYPDILFWSFYWLSFVNLCLTCAILVSNFGNICISPQLDFVQFWLECWALHCSVTPLCILNSSASIAYKVCKHYARLFLTFLHCVLEEEYHYITISSSVLKIARSQKRS